MKRKRIKINKERESKTKRANTEWSENFLIIFITTTTKKIEKGVRTRVRER